MLFRQLFDPETSTFTYLLADEQTREAVLIDPVREHYARDTQLLDELGLHLVHTLETHVHADHVTSSGQFRRDRGARSVVSAKGGAACADVLVAHGDVVSFGRYRLEVRATPGHTDGCVTYVDPHGQRAFTGDALLIRGCGRTDFQQGDAATLYHSIHEQVFTLPDDWSLYPGHDYKGRTATTVGEEKRFNPRLGGGRTQAEFVAIMAALDLPEPRKIAEAVPANLECGLPDADPAASDDGRWDGVQVTPTGIPEVTYAWWKDHGEGLRLIDVRQPEEFEDALGHLPGAELVPLGTLGHAAADWDRHEPLVVVCRSGGRSGRAALGLLGMGFDRVVSLRGGMLAVQAADGSCG